MLYARTVCKAARDAVPEPFLPLLLLPFWVGPVRAAFFSLFDGGRGMRSAQLAAGLMIRPQAQGSKGRNRRSVADDRVGETRNLPVVAVRRLDLSVEVLADDPESPAQRTVSTATAKT